MSKTLQEIVGDELSFIAKLIENNGEISEEMEASMALGEENLPQKIDDYAYRIDRLALEVSHLDKRKKEIDNIMKNLKTSQEWLRNNMKISMIALKKDRAEGNNFYFKLSSSKPKVSIDNDAKIPAIYMKEKVESVIDVDLLKEDLTKGTVIPGAKLVDVFSIRKYVQKTGGK
jgi:hypothetical protein